MQTIEVSRRLAIWTLVGVCALSAGIGASIMLLAETGPAGKEGAPGERGPTGARGPQGPEGEIEGPDFGAFEVFCAANPSFQISSNLNWIKGAHSIKGGFNFFRKKEEDFDYIRYVAFDQQFRISQVQVLPRAICEKPGTKPWKFVACPTRKRSGSRRR